MQQSNLYIILYTFALTAICGAVLATAALGLKSAQDANVALEKRQNILQTVMEVPTREAAASIYKERVRSYVINFKGEVVEKDATGSKIVPEDLDVAKEWKKKPEERLLPIFEILSTDKSKTEYYVLPVYGYGLWNDIWGYVSLKSDLNTIYGVKFDHKGETPGLGARIATDEVQKRYKEKQLFAGNELKSVLMMKGEGNDYNTDKHKVDGMSGATITGVGVNAMLKDYFACYQNFIQAKSKKLSLNE